jgi:hypothetical protein
MAGLCTAAAGANVGNCGSRAFTRRNSASRARAIAADIAKFAAGAITDSSIGRKVSGGGEEVRSLPFEVILVTEN